MQWSGAAGAGFTDAPERAWLPIGDASARNVEAQRADPSSTLRLCRDAIALRRSQPSLRTGAYEPVAAPDGVWAWRRGTDVLVALNLSDAPATVDDGDGVVALSSDRAREGSVGRRLTLAAWEGVVVTAAG